MHRILILVTLTGLLAACSGQGGSTNESPDAAVSTPASSPQGSGDAAGAGAAGASAECSESFADLESAGVSSITELGDLPNEVEPTVESCESLDDWIAGAQDVIGGEINPNTAALLLRMSCGDPSLSSTALCQELASS